MTIPIDLVDDFQNNIHHMKKQMDKLKNSFDPMGVYFCVKMMSFLPSVLAKLISQD
jgi:hypothetical protein